jgi:hypothetical protein
MYLEYPELERLRFNYRPDLSHHAQALIDLKKFKQKCVLRDRMTEAKIAELELELEHNMKVDNRHNHTASEVESKRLKEYLKEDETLIQESTSKPRALLTTFVRASQNEDKENEHDSHLNSDAFEYSRSSNAKYSREAFHAEDWTHHSEKKVRWQQDDIKPIDIKKTKRTEAKKNTETTYTSMQKAKGASKRQAFGSSDKPKASDGQAKYDVKDTSVGKEKIKIPAALSSTSHPLSNTKVPIAIKNISSSSKLQSDCEGTTGKKRASSSRQLSGISSQERSSKLGRRRKRSSQSGEASVGSKSGGHRDLDDDEYNFNFAKL